MIKDIKDFLCTEEVYNIYSACMFEPTFEKFKTKVAKMQNDFSVSAYGYFLNETIIGIIATQENNDVVEIIGIAVDSQKRHFGIGTKLIDYISKKYEKKIIAETDSEAVMFYKKCGFDIKENIVSKSDISYSRYVCTLKDTKL